MARSAKDLENNRRTLANETRDMRDATRALDYSEQDRAAGEILVAVNHLEALIEKDKMERKKEEEKLALLLRQTEQILRRAEQLANMAAKPHQELQEAATSGILEAHSVATEYALKEIAEVADAAKSQIRVAQKQAQARTMRLLKNTLPDKLFQTLKWLLIVLGIVIAGHYIFFIMLAK